MSRSWCSGLDMAISSLPLGVVLLILSGTHALQVTPGSSCSDICQSSALTSSSDIVCADVDYYSSSIGDTFKDCIQCLQTSNAKSDLENDVSWFLYNLRYASAVCLYDFPKHRHNSTASCDLEYACSPLQGALESGNLDLSNETEYGYCQADNSAFYGTAIDDCVSCLQSSSSNYMANFLLALQAGCEQEPAAGQVLGISGDIFSGNAISISNSTTSLNSTSSGGGDDGTLSTGAKIGIGVSLGGLFLAAISLFIIYWRHQRRYEQQENGDTHPYEFRGQYYCPKEPDTGGPSSMSTPPNYVLQNYTVDHKSRFSGPTVSSTPEPEQRHQPGLHLDLPVKEFINNADYYDRLEGKSRGRPLKALPLRLHPTNDALSDNGSSIGTSTVVENNESSGLPTHPAYIPRSQFPGQLGGRASRNTNKTAIIGGGASSASQRSSSSVSSSAAAQKDWRKSNKPDSYAIQVYLNTPEDCNKPARNLQLELAERTDTQGADGHHYHHYQKQQQLAPPSVPTNGRGTPFPLLPPQGGRGMPAPAQFKAGETTASRLPSLILPPVPRIRVPGRKAGPPPPSHSSRAEDSVPLNRDIAIHHSIISGPLAFSGSRCSASPAQDRIVEQTADRGGQFMEVPIGSGKSYLYG